MPRGREAASSAAAEWHQVVVLKGAKTVIAAPDGSVAVAPFENPAMATGGTGDVLAGTIGALLAQGLAPYDAARLGVYLHGLAGEAVRDRIGDAGLLAGDLPDALPIGRKRLARIAERTQADGGSGSGCDRGVRRGAATATPARGAAGSLGLSDARAGEPIEARLAAAGLPPLPRHRLAGARPRRPAREPRDDPADGWAPGVRVEPVVKADAYGHGAVPIARALAAAGADGLSVATVDEAFELRDGGVELPLLVLYPIPPEQVAAAAASSIAVSVGSGPLTDAILAAAGGRRVGGAPDLEVHVEIETGLGRGGALPGAAARRRPCRSSTRPGVRLGGVWTHLAAAERRLGHARAGRAVRAPPSRGSSTRSSSGPTRVRRHLAGSGGILGADAGHWDAVRPGLVDLRPGARCDHAARRDGRGVGGPAPGDGAARAAGAGRGPAGRSRRQLRAVVRDLATVADRDPAGRLR